MRMLKEGTLPDGYTVKKRKLVKRRGKKHQEGCRRPPEASP